MPQKRILVLCTGNSARSQMAEGWLNTIYNSRVEAVSAGSRPVDHVHPLAIQVMAEAGVDIRGGKPKHLEQFIGQPFDQVITVCDDANEACPVFPGAVSRLHHSFRDPARAPGTDEQRLAVFRQVRDEIRRWVEQDLII
jgi:arsenate reductase